VWIASSLQQVLKPTAIALGNFDGVHRGHREVIAPAVAFGRSQALSQQQSSQQQSSQQQSSQQQSSQQQSSQQQSSQQQSSQPSGPQTVHSTVVSFHPHPQEYFSGVAKPLLTPDREKAEQLAALGVEQLVLLPFDKTLARLTPTEFVELLLQNLHPQFISVGQDFHFGKGRQGNVTDLHAIAASSQALAFGRPGSHNLAPGLQINIVGLCYSEQDQPGDERISSSRIRAALTAGDVATAKLLLGRPYRLQGQVVHGRQLGRTIGFPTANLQLPANKFLPKQGVYAVRLSLPSPQGPLAKTGVMNIGTRPTLAGQALVAEVLVFDWNGDLYGQTLTVDLEHFLRPEQKFASLEDLKAQIQQDCDRARQLLGSTPYPPERYVC
jgi:riboflavin kinase / FMN adenylyltransferase